ncbi:TPA: hypothetical protein N0F65_011873 [Lagenidium giganteum]|uniref:Protein preY, mitochondrial n=1 Tax=Lagenidium giganteum TaxID=4803 RepID=A0AAV2YEX5_9STRA|nr:TPA: hypothetical protein N0F65_011873 [Lagenidium giganteum]
MMMWLTTTLRSTQSLRQRVRVVQQRAFAASASHQTSTLEDPSVMDHLVCPISKLPLRYDAARGLIICPEIRVAYPVRNGVPVLVPTEGRILRDDEEA